MAAAVTDAFGIASSSDGIDFAGRTDRGLIRDFFQRDGIAESEENIARYCESFLRLLADYLPNHEGRILEGVEEIVKSLAEREDVRLGLITGNLLQAARLKLGHFGLEEYFFPDQEPLGGFGDHQIHRDDMAQDAMQSLEDAMGGAVARDKTWIIGDTPRDVQCARAVGIRVAAVATGRYSAEQLAETRPDVVLNDLTEPSEWFDSMGWRR